MHAKLPLTALCLSLMACVGESVHDDVVSSGRSIPSGGIRSLADCQGVVEPGPSPLRRLTRREYSATVQDLLGLTTTVASTLSEDPLTRGFDNNAKNQTVAENQAEQYMNAAETLAKAANLSTLAPCSTRSPNDACATQFITEFGLRAYRRPLTSAEQDRLMTLFRAGVAQGPGFEAGLRFVLETVLQSSAFLYRSELNAASTSIALQSPYTLASRLSYFFWGTMPDDELFRAAAAGELSSSAQVRAQAVRMLQDPRTRHQVATFHEQWLGLAELSGVQKNETLYPTWSTLKASLRQETETFVDHVFWDERSAAKLLTADFTYGDAKVAQHYGVAAPSGEGIGRLALKTGRRAGLLGQGSLLSMHAHSNQTSPVHRGKFVRQALLCQDLTPPPEGVDTNVTEPSPTLTTRERFSAHRDREPCRSCHRLMDPVGLGLENFDAVGAWRDVEASKPIDASGEVTDATDANGVFVGAEALGQKLAQSDLFNDCMVRHWFRFTFGRLETALDACTIARGKDVLMKSGGDFTELLLSLAQSDAFLYRAPQVTQ